MRRFMQLAVHVLLQAIRDLSRQSENASKSFDLFQTEWMSCVSQPDWLPAPKASLNLTMRLYAPKSEARTGKWNPRPVVRTPETVGLAVQ
jgi:hypothetical protein